MVRSAAAITQQICAVLIFFVSFESSAFKIIAHTWHRCVFGVGWLWGASYPPPATFALFTGAHLSSYQFLRNRADTSDTLISCLLFCAPLSLLSPVLRKLTKSFADDTICALAMSLGLLHLITHDYNYVISGVGR
ncbi:hypothetical protein PsorP6_005783 [Peronosclerospora sorghi]|uniref:Uncharacterized protein n=1 Tax=Peronosclerospora sorghi TaxID=230839 RepID=A0ACC0W1Z2_9STRA|nr:hypothetical protein PsorP6_005783 [Peronosclerospora sorghi]